MSETTHLPLPAFLAQTLESLLPVLSDEQPLSSSVSQTILAKGLDDLYLVARMITTLGVFSENENIEELGDGALIFMATGWILGDIESRTGLSGYDDRVACLRRSDAAYSAFLHLISTYGVLSSEESSESSAIAESSARSAPRDPALKREAKILQYRREKDLREKISNALGGRLAPSNSPVSFLLAFLQPTSGKNPSTSVNPEYAETQRRSIILLLRLLYTLTVVSTSHNTMELELLASAPREPAAASSSSASMPSRIDEANDHTWRLDRSTTRYTPRELISGGGRVLRPFTILPSTSNMSDRERLTGEVFRNGHRLPTMTIDEYLDEEKRRGNIITGGGQASADAPTTSELLELESENDGTVRGGEAAEEKRLKEEYWAQYGEVNKRGAGNTTNRG